MKKTLLSCALITSSLLTTVSAQESGWYNYGYELQTNIGAQVDYFQSHIFPDSTVQVEYSSGLGAVWMHSLGQVFDPRSVYYDFGSASVIENQSYTIDSIGFPYRYLRTQDTNPDTLIIQLFKQENIDTLFVDPWPDGAYADRSYARLYYDSLLHRGEAPFLEITELLDFSDTSSVGGWLELAIGEEIPANEVFAINVTYYPGNPYNSGDTLDAEFDPSPVNVINDFIMNYYVDEDISLDVGHYNHGIIGDDAARYNINDNGWGGQFWPGMASGGGLYHAAISAKLTTIVGIEEESNSLNSTVFPNPCNGITNVSFELNQSSTVTIEIISLDGKVVSSSNLGKLSSGKQINTMDLSLLSKGVYFMSIKTDEGVSTQRIIMN